MKLFSWLFRRKPKPFEGYLSLDEVDYALHHNGIRVVPEEHTLQIGDVVTLPAFQPLGLGKNEEKVGWDLGIYYPGRNNYCWMPVRSRNGNFYGECDVSKWKWTGLNVSIEEWNAFWR